MTTEALKKYQNFLEFISEYHPRWYESEEVTKADILFRFLDGEEVSKEDEEYIRKTYCKNREIDKPQIVRDIIRIERKLAAEAIECFYLEQFLLDPPQNEKKKDLSNKKKENENLDA